MNTQMSLTNQPVVDVNHVVLIGRAGKDPEMRYFESGKVVTTFSLAVNRPLKDGQTDWFDVEIWGKPAEIAGEYVKKGSLIGVEGKVRWDSWLHKETGEPMTRPMVIADNIRLLGSKKDNNAQGQNAVPQTSIPQVSSGPGF